MVLHTLLQSDLLLAAVAAPLYQTHSLQQDLCDIYPHVAKYIYANVPGVDICAMSRNGVDLA